MLYFPLYIIQASLSCFCVQGGKFDHADRLFQSIDATYRNCLSNTSDVKELIPEFFYMPEFLINSNSYHLGVKQDGEPLGDVCLPPWAKVCKCPLIGTGEMILLDVYTLLLVKVFRDLVIVALVNSVLLHSSTS